MKKLVLALVLLVAASPAFAGDIYVKVKSHSDAMSAMGQSQPARDDVSEQWFSGNRAAQSSKDSGFIVDLDKQVAYLIFHADKSYLEMPLPIDMVKVLPPEAQAMAPMLQMTATVRQTTETKSIGAYPCTAYDATLTVAGMPMTMRMWTSTSVPGDLAAFAGKMLPIFMQATMRLNPASVEEFAKVKGFQIATEITGDMMGAKIHTTTEVVEIAEKAAPAGTYEPPAGYKKKTALTMQDLMRR